MTLSFSARACALACLLCSTFPLFSQDHNPLVHSGQVLKEGISLHDQGEFTKAIQLYLTVSPADTNYAVVQAELALSYLDNKDFEKAIGAGQRAMAAKMHAPQPYVTIGSALDEMGKPEEALNIYGEGLAKYPYEHLLYFNRAVTRIRLQQYELAIQDLQRSIRINPLHGSSHLQLAKLMVRQGQTAHAFLSLLAFLTIEPAAERSNGVLVYLENLANLAPDHQPAEFMASFTDNDSFQELDALFASKAALAKNYKTQVKFEAALVRQLQLLFEKLPQRNDSPDFWMTYYAPLVYSLREQKLLVPLTYQILYSTNRPEVQKWVKKNTGLMEKLNDAERKALLTIRDFHTLEENGTRVKYEAWFHNSGKLSGLGNIKATGSEERVGKWRLYDEDGNLQATGQYNQAGKKEGEWQYFYRDGTLFEKESYNANEDLHGPYVSFYDNGQKQTEAQYRDGQAEGEVRTYYGCGTLKKRINFKQGKRNGLEQEFYPSGQLARACNYQDDEKQGLETEYHQNGEVENEVNYVKNQLEGEYRAWHDNKKPKVKGAFAADQQQGIWTHYHANGKVEATGAMGKGQPTGPWTGYYASGVKSTEKVFDEQGELTGAYREYDEDGKLYAVTQYEQGLVKGYTYYDKADKEVGQAASPKGTFPIKTISPDGGLTGEGAYQNGKMHGDWKYFHPNGQLKTLKTYREGLTQGAATEYFVTGELKIKANFLDDNLDGYYQEFYSNGQIQAEGWYKGGDRQGTWYTYYANGNREEVSYFLHGRLSGWEESFAASGQPSLRTLYENGQILAVQTFDPTGQLRDDLDFHSGNGAYNFTFPDGKPRAKGTISCFDLNGAFTWYAPDGKVVSERNFQAGFRHGPYKTFYDNGKPDTEGFYENGIPVGQLKQYDPAGKLKRIGFYKAGDLDSTWTSYHPNGKISSVRTYLHDNLYGKASFYDPAGKLLYHKWYNRHGHPQKIEVLGANKQTVVIPLSAQGDGKVVAYFDNGKMAVEETYRAGYFDGTRTTYHPNGNRRTVEQFANGESQGPDLEFYPNGKLKIESAYLNGNLHGPYRTFREDGTLETESHYVCGQKDGLERHFTSSGKIIKTHIYWNNIRYATN